MLKLFLRWFQLLYMPCFFGIGEGPSNQEKTQYGKVANIGDFGTSQGEKDILQSDAFWSTLLSGDPSKTAQVLGPQISAINKQGQEELKTMSEFGNRSGGTGAAAQRVGDTTRSRYDTLQSGLLTSAAGELGSGGRSLLSTGLGAHEAGFDMAKVMHDQNMAKWNDIFKSITSVASAFLPGAGGLSLPGAGGLSAPFSGMTGGEISGVFGGPTEATPSISTIQDNTVS